MFTSYIRFSKYKVVGNGTNNGGSIEDRPEKASQTSLGLGCHFYRDDQYWK